eukprot:g10457.t1
MPAHQRVRGIRGRIRFFRRRKSRNRDRVFPVCVGHPAAEPLMRFFQRLAAEAPGVMRVPQDSDRRARHLAQRLGNDARVGIIAMRFDDDVHPQCFPELSKNIQTLDDAAHRLLSRVGLIGIRQHITEDPYEPRPQIAGQFEIRPADLDVARTVRCVGMVEPYRRTETANLEPRVSEFLHPPRTLRGLKLGQRQQIGFALNQPDFDAVVPVSAPIFNDLPPGPGYFAEAYDIEIGTRYAGVEIPNPFGKASGQLSMTAQQVVDDVAAGLGFVVLKTVIACDETGAQSMEAWAVKQARMVAERITGADGESGWTISWKGRGWWQSFEDYLKLVTDAREIAADSQTLIVPSCKYHLPTSDAEEWKISEYLYTTRQLCRAWQRRGTDAVDDVMPLEKDFSPTLAGSDRASAQSRILDWLRTTTRLIQSAVHPAASEEDASLPAVRVGLKIFNALFDDAFQLEMLRTVDALSGTERPDFLIYGNRLFDPDREFDGHRGIAYGGPDLSNRNLRVMSAFQHEQENAPRSHASLPWSATGNIATGKMALEYALRGAENFQLHTYFQLPSDQYSMRDGSKTQKALHELYFHPQTGFAVWLKHLGKRLAITDRPVRFRDVIGRAVDVSPGD